ncbi:hypothetical protein DM860_013774 [Cuscuta australis]|uniref:ABC transporter domain-containing protein n=1 Tax=Cuscuta australis TaxID=267555 RepID=A0A328DL58_9ASTE|nr:hypothetical protein DM860_013774 [Cuscuta australis]
MEDEIRAAGGLPVEIRRRQMSRNASRSGWSVEEVFSSGVHGRRSTRGEEDEEALRWAALEKLPTYDRMRKTVLKTFSEEDRDRVVHKEVDVRKLETTFRQDFINRVFKVAEEDNERFLKKLRDRIDKVGISLPTVEVRFKDLNVEADCHVGDRALPTLLNTLRNLGDSALASLGINFAQNTKLTILKHASGIVKPSRITLLLGPPSSGKTSLLLALAGKLDPALKVRGEITYNGHKLTEFVPQKTSAYISQNDVHVGEMTVKETLDFSARCQGVGSRYELLTELARRERDAKFLPDAEIDLYMKQDFSFRMEARFQLLETLIMSTITLDKLIALLEMVLYGEIEHDEGVCILYDYIDEMITNLQSFRPIEGFGSCFLNFADFDSFRDTKFQNKNDECHPKLGVFKNRSGPDFGPEPDRNGPVWTGPEDSGPVFGPKEIAIPVPVLTGAGPVRSGFGPVHTPIQNLINAPLSPPNLAHMVTIPNTESHEKESKDDSSVESYVGDNMDSGPELINAEDEGSNVVGKNNEFALLEGVDKVTYEDCIHADNPILLDTIALLDIVGLIGSELI